MQLSLALSFLDVAAIEEVPLDLWKEVFAVAGWPPSLVVKRTSFTHEDLSNALNRDEVSDHLLQALETLDNLGSEAGREAILAAMNDCGVSLVTLPKETGVRELALRLFLAQQDNASMADVFARARTQVQEGSDHRRYNEFMGKEAQRIESLKIKARALEERVLQYCKDCDLGDHVEVRAFEDDGVYVFSVIRSHHMKTPLAVVQGRTARATIQYRPIHCDLLRYEASVGRLRIAVRATSMVEFYRRGLGAALFEDETFFEGDPVCNLSVLQERSRAALNDHNVYGVGQIRMTECLWERGEELLHFRGSDCFRTIEGLQLPFSEGRILQAKLKIQVVGKGTRPVTVNIRVPSRIEISQKSHERLIEQVLEAIGIRNVAPKPVATVDLWSMQPLRQSVPLWRMLFGSDLDTLVQQRVLTQTKLESIAHPDHPAAGRVLDAHALSGTEYYAVSKMPEISSRTVSATDLDGLELHPEELRLYLRSRLGIIEGGSIWDGQESLDLGMIQVGDHRIHANYALKQPSAGIGDRIRAHANGAHPVLLVPASQSCNADLAKVMLDTALPKPVALIRGAILACGLTKLVPALHVAPEGARLIVDNQIKKVWFDGVEVSDVQPESHAFLFIEIMARQSPALVSADEIIKYLSPGRQDGSTTARRAKADAKRLIKMVLTKEGRDFEEDIFPTAGTGFYRCSVLAYVQ